VDKIHCLVFLPSSLRGKANHKVKYMLLTKVHYHTWILNVLVFDMLMHGILVYVCRTCVVCVCVYCESPGSFAHPSLASLAKFVAFWRKFLTNFSLWLTHLTYNC
jgi:hypothetical protein